MSNKKLLLDTNIFLDCFLERDGYETSRDILTLCEKGIYQGCIAVHSLPTIFYYASKSIGNISAQEYIRDIQKMCIIAGLVSEDVGEALGAGFGDFEDALQYICARNIAADYIITRNKKDFAQSDIVVMSPEEFLEKDMSMIF